MEWGPVIALPTEPCHRPPPRRAPVTAPHGCAACPPPPAPPLRPPPWKRSPPPAVRVCAPSGRAGACAAAARGGPRAARESETRACVGRCRGGDGGNGGDGGHGGAAGGGAGRASTAPWRWPAPRCAVRSSGVWFGAWPLRSLAHSPSLSPSRRFSLARTSCFRGGSGCVPLDHTRATPPPWDRTPTSLLRRPADGAVAVSALPPP